MPAVYKTVKMILNKISLLFDYLINAKTCKSQLEIEV